MVEIYWLLQEGATSIFRVEECSAIGSSTFLQNVYKFLSATWYHMQYVNIQYGINEIKLIEISPFAIWTFTLGSAYPISSLT
jgi:hypothetical protein